MAKSKKDDNWFLKLSSDTPSKFLKRNKAWGLKNVQKGDRFALEVVKKEDTSVSFNFIKI